MREERKAFAPKKVISVALQTVGSHPSRSPSGDEPGARCVAACAVVCRMSAPGETRTLGPFTGEEGDIYNSFLDAIKAEDADIIVGHGTHRYFFQWLLDASLRISDARKSARPVVAAAAMAKPAAKPVVKQAVKQAPKNQTLLWQKPGKAQQSVVIPGKPPPRVFAEPVRPHLLEGWGRVLQRAAVELTPDPQDEARSVVLCSGRASLDLEMWLQRNLKLRSYDLDDACAKFLDMPLVVPEYKERFKLAQTPDGLVKLAEAARDEAVAVMRLAFAPSLRPLHKELSCAAVTGAPLQECSTRGTQHVLREKIMREKGKFVLPDGPPVDRKRKAAEESGAREIGFKGGVLQKALPGLYAWNSEDPEKCGRVITMDFGSLYPSIMMADNICPTTRITVADAEAMGVRISDMLPDPRGFEGDWVDAQGTSIHIGEWPEDGDAPLGDGRTARLHLDSECRVDAHSLDISDGTTMRRAPETSLAFVHPDVHRGIVPTLLEKLKKDRNAAKRQAKVRFFTLCKCNAIPLTAAPLVQKLNKKKNIMPYTGSQG